MLFHPFKIFLGTGKIHLVADQNLRTVGQITVILQFMIDLFIVFHGVSGFHAGNVHEMEKQTGPVDMPEKIMAKADAF